MKKKRRTYRRLRMSEREEISRYLSQKMGIRWIARDIGLVHLNGVLADCIARCAPGRLKRR